MGPADAPQVAVHQLDGDVVQGAGVIQGGVLAGLIGEAVERFAAAAVGAGRTNELETLDVTLERPALPGAYRVEAALVRQGRSLLAYDARLVDASGRTVASARTTHRVRDAAR